MPRCPNCGEETGKDSNFCRKCGYNLINENQNNYNPYEEYTPAYGKVTRIVERKLDNSKIVNKIIDITTPHNLNFQEKHEKWGPYNEKYFKYIEPECLEVYNTIEDDFIKSLFLLERAKHVGGNTALGFETVFPSTTKFLSHEESIEFYKTILRKVINELDIERQKPNFNKRDYLKKKNKELFVEKVSNLGIPRRLR